MDVAGVVAPQLGPQLADRLQERQRLDVAHGPADLGDQDIRARVLPQRPDPLLDRVGDVRDDLDGVAEEIASALLRDHVRVDGTGGHVGGPKEVLVDEALVVAEVEVGLAAVLGDEHLPVLEGVHRARVDVDVGV